MQNQFQPIKCQNWKHPLAIRLNETKGSRDINQSLDPWILPACNNFFLSFLDLGHGTKGKRKGVSRFLLAARWPNNQEKNNWSRSSNSENEQTLSILKILKFEWLLIDKFKSRCTQGPEIFRSHLHQVLLRAQMSGMSGQAEEMCCSIVTIDSLTDLNQNIYGCMVNTWGTHGKYTHLFNFQPPKILAVNQGPQKRPFLFFFAGRVSLWSLVHSSSKLVPQNQQLLFRSHVVLLVAVIVDMDVYSCCSCSCPCSDSCCLFVVVVVVAMVPDERQTPGH